MECYFNPEGDHHVGSVHYIEPCLATDLHQKKKEKKKIWSETHSLLSCWVSESGR